MNERNKAKKVKDTVLIVYWTSGRGDIPNAVEDWYSNAVEDSATAMLLNPAKNVFYDPAKISAIMTFLLYYFVVFIFLCFFYPELLLFDNAYLSALQLWVLLGQSSRRSSLNYET